jgi:hypothetical protein
MKKLFVVLVAGAFCFSAVSCKKDCKCSGVYKTEIEGMDPIEITLEPTSVGEFSKSDCEAFNWAIDVPVPEVTYTYNITCKSE